MRKDHLLSVTRRQEQAGCALRPCAALLLALALPLAAQESLIPSSPDPALLRQAERLGFPLTLSGDGLVQGGFQAGDELTYVAELNEDGKRSQWLIHMHWQSDDAGSGPSVKRYASSGDTFEYSTAAGALRVDTLGPTPVSAGKPPNEVSKVIKVEKDFLQLGFHDNARLWTKVRNRKSSDPTLPDFWFFTNRSTPVDAGTVAAQQEVMALYQITSEDLRILSSDGVAFDTLMRQLNNTPGVSEILWQIADKPSRWSLLRGLQTNVTHYGSELSLDTQAVAESLAVPVNSQFYLVSFNNRESLRLDIYAAPASGVLLPSAGVVGLIARPADPDRKKVLLVTLLGARRDA